MVVWRKILFSLSIRSMYRYSSFTCWIVSAAVARLVVRHRFRFPIGTAATRRIYLSGSQQRRWMALGRRANLMGAVSMVDRLRRSTTMMTATWQRNVCARERPYGFWSVLVGFFWCGIFSKSSVAARIPCAPQNEQSFRCKGHRWTSKVKGRWRVVLRSIRRFWE